MPRKRSLLIGLAVALGACESSDSAYDRGYSDGYAAAYNTACDIRPTIVAGDWDNKHYARGYANGQSDGMIACNADRQRGRVR